MFFDKLLEATDIFRQRIRLTMNKSDIFTTRLGNIMTLVVVILTILQSISAVKRVANYEFPQLDNTIQSVQDPGPLSLNSSNFLFAITVQNTDFNLSSAYLTFQMQMRRYIRHGNGTIQKIITPVPLKKCDLTYMANYSDQFDRFGLRQALCPSISEYNIGGGYLSDVFEFIKLRVMTCQNDTTQPDIVCKDTPSVLNALANNTVTVALIYTQNTIDENNYKEPVKQYLSTLNWNTSPGLQTLGSDLFLNEYQMKTDDGIWFENLNVYNETTHALDVNQERLQFSSVERLDESNYVLFNLYLRKSSNIYFKTRTFPKVQQMLATIGGIFSLFVTVAGAVMAFYARYMYYVTISEKLYEFEVEKKPKSGAEPNELPSNYNKFKKIAQNFVKYSEKGIKKLDYSFCDYLYSITFGYCCPRRKDILCKKGVELVQQDIDILQIVKKLQELEKLKNVILNKDQLTVFSYTRRPLIKEADKEELLKKQLRKGKKKTSYTTRENRGRPNKTKTNKSFQRSRTLVERTSQALQQETENFDDLHRFMTLFDSYRKLAHIASRTPFDEKILNLLDNEMHETLYDLEFDMKENPEITREYYMLLACRAFEELLTKLRNPKMAKFTKLGAATFIAKKLVKKIKDRREKLTSEGSPTNRRERTRCRPREYSTGIFNTMQNSSMFLVKSNQKEPHSATNIELTYLKDSSIPKSYNLDQIPDPIQEQTEEQTLGRTLEQTLGRTQEQALDRDPTQSFKKPRIKKKLTFPPAKEFTHVSKSQDSSPQANAFESKEDEPSSALRLRKIEEGPISNEAEIARENAHDKSAIINVSFDTPPSWRTEHLETDLVLRELSIVLEMSKPHYQYDEEVQNCFSPKSNANKSSTY